MYTRTTFTVGNVYNAIRLQHRDKAVGPDGIASEAYLYGTPCLFEHITSLLNLYVNHNYLLCLLMESRLVPLVKNKNGNLCDVNNYRAIVLSDSITKILESVMLPLIMKSDDSDKHQFGFKSGHSTTRCTKVFKNVVNYYADRGSHVFACYVDFSKAFDKVNYWKLFNFLLDDNVPVDIVSLLALRYSHQEVYVRWQNIFFLKFCMSNGTRQGSSSFPYLFARYIRGLILFISKL